MKSTPDPSSDELKARHERTVFTRFALAARVAIDPVTVESRAPPAPDILCSTVLGEPLAFELVELCSPEIAKAVGDDLKRGGGATFTFNADPTRAVLMKKLRKTYVCDVPVDLLCYANGFLVTPDSAVLDEIREVIETEGFGPFRSIWFHGEESVYRMP
jgi:hypothetical protein